MHKKNHNIKINYTYTNIDNVINMLELIESVCMMSPKYDKEPNYDIDDKNPKVILRTCNAPFNVNDTRSRVSLRMV